MKYVENFDHHSENYIGIEGSYNGMDYNDYLFEMSID